jgi:hypothetical protein
MADKKAAAALALKERSRGKRFKLVEGDTTFRVLPNALGVEQPDYVQYGMHSEVGPRKAFIRCGKSASGKGSCWLCDTMIPKLQASGKAAHTQIAERMARKDIFAVQIAYLDQSTDTWIGPVLWETPGTVTQALLSLMSRRDIAHPEKGYNLLINRTGTGMKDTRYGQVERDDEPSEVDEAVMARLKPFKEVVKKYDESQLKSAYYGHDQEDEEPVPDDDEETKPVGKKKPAVVEEEDTPVPVSKNGHKKRPVPAEDEDEPVVEDEDEPVIAPKAGKKKPAPEPEPEEDEDAELAALEEFEEEVPDLEDEDAPKPKAGKKKPAPVEEDPEEPEEEPVKPTGKKKPTKPVEDDQDF